MTDDQVQVTASLMIRDLTIAAKQHLDLSRSFRAMARTWRQVLDDTARSVLQPNDQGDSVLGAPPVVEPEIMRRDYD